MKKTIKGIIAGILACLMLFAFTGCVSKNWAKVEEQLIDKQYDVEVYADEGDIEISLIIACINTYTDEYIAPASIEKFVYATKGSLNVCVIYCETAGAAKELKERVEEVETDLAKKFGYEEGEYKIAREGKVVYFGHKQAIKAL